MHRGVRVENTLTEVNCQTHLLPGEDHLRRVVHEDDKSSRLKIRTKIEPEMTGICSR